MTERAIAEQHAMVLARNLHAGQNDKSGKPYLEHLERVAGIMKRRFAAYTPAMIEAAWLHGAICLTTATADSLLRDGVSEEAVGLVAMLTWPSDMFYLVWIKRLIESGNQAAIRIKLADVEDNMSPSRLAGRPEGQAVLGIRYSLAHAMLAAAS